MESNIEAWQIWQKVADQIQIHQTSNPKKPKITLRLEAVIPAINLLIANPEKRRSSFDKVLWLHEISQCGSIFDFFKKYPPDIKDD